MLVLLGRKNSDGTIGLPLIWGRWTGYLLQQQRSCDGCGQRPWDDKVRSTLTNSCNMFWWSGLATQYSEMARWSGVALRQRRNSKWPGNRLALQ